MLATGFCSSQGSHNRINQAPNKHNKKNIVGYTSSVELTKKKRKKKKKACKIYRTQTCTHIGYKRIENSQKKKKYFFFLLFEKKEKKYGRMQLPRSSPQYALSTFFSLKNRYKKKKMIVDNGGELASRGERHQNELGRPSAELMTFTPSRKNCDTLQT